MGIPEMDVRVQVALPVQSKTVEQRMPVEDISHCSLVKSEIDESGSSG